MHPAAWARCKTEALADFGGPLPQPPKGRCCCSVTRYFPRRARSQTNAHLSTPRASAAICDRLRRARATPASQCSSPSRLARYVAHCSRELATWQVTLGLLLDTVPRAPTAALPDPEHWPPLNEHRCVRGAAAARDEPAVTTHTKCLTVTHSDTGRRREAAPASTLDYYRPYPGALKAGC